MTKRLTLYLALLLASLAVPAAAQNVRQMTRSTAVTGANDSALVTISDSAGTAAAPRTRALSLHELFKRPTGTAAKPTYTFALDSNTGIWRIGEDTLGFTTNGASGQQLMLTPNGLAPVVNEGVSLGTNTRGFAGIRASTIMGAPGSAAGPSFTFRSASVTDDDAGMYRVGADTVGFATAGLLRGFFSASGLTLSRTNGANGVNLIQGTDGTGRILSGDGSAASPSYSFAVSTQDDNGMYRFGADTLGWSTSGVARMRLQSTGLFPTTDNSIALGSPTFRWSDIRANTATFSGAITVASCTGCAGSFPLLAPNGSTAAPSYSFTDETNTGIIRDGNGYIGFVDGGSQLLAVGGGAIRASSQFSSTNGTAASPGIAFFSQSNLGLFRHNTDTLGLAASGRLAVAVRDSQVLATPGRNGKPSYSFLGDDDTGIFWQSADVLALGAGGANRVRVDAGGLYVNSNGSQATPAVRISDTGIGFYKQGNGTDTLAVVTGATTRFRWAGSTIMGGSSNMTILAGDGASRTLTLQGTTAASAVKTFVTMADGTVSMGSGQQLRFTGGSAATPGLVSSVDTDDGFFVDKPDTLSFAVDGTRVLEFSGTSGGTSNITGGDGNMTITPGTGNSRTLTLRGTGSSGTAVSTMVVVDSQVQLQMGRPGRPAYSFPTLPNLGMYAVAGDTLGLSAGGFSRVKIRDNAATAAGDVNMCLSTSQVLRIGATCGSSSSKVKTAITSLQGNLALALRPVSYTYKKGFYDQRAEFGLIAEEAAKVDPRFAFYAAADDRLPDGSVIKKGEAFNVNDRAVIAALLATVQYQEKRINELTARVDSLAKGKP